MSYINNFSSGQPGVELCGCVTVKNISDRTIPVWTPAAICDKRAHIALNGKTTDVFEAVPAVNNSAAWGMALTEISPGEYGSVQLTGVAPAWTGIGAGGRVTPSENGLVGSSRGRGEVLISGQEPYYPAMLLLSSPAGDEYNGGFKVICTGSGKCRVIDGIYPDNPWCGRTDLPGADNVAAAEVDILSHNPAYIYLRAYKDETREGYYKADIGLADNDALFNRLLATVYDGAFAEQVFEGSEVIFGRDYFL